MSTFRFPSGRSCPSRRKKQLLIWNETTINITIQSSQKRSFFDLAINRRVYHIRNLKPIPPSAPFLFFFIPFIPPILTLSHFLSIHLPSLFVPSCRFFLFFCSLCFFLFEVNSAIGKDYKITYMHYISAIMHAFYISKNPPDATF